MDESESNANLTSELVSEKEKELSEMAFEPEQNNCQGYKVNPVSKLYLCNACEYHKRRNESRPWLKVKA